MHLPSLFLVVVGILLIPALSWICVFMYIHIHMCVCVRVCRYRFRNPFAIFLVDVLCRIRRREPLLQSWLSILGCCMPLIVIGSLPGWNKRQKTLLSGRSKKTLHHTFFMTQSPCPCENGNLEPPCTKLWTTAEWNNLLESLLMVPQERARDGRVAGNTL